MFGDLWTLDHSAPLPVPAGALHAWHRSVVPPTPSTALDHPASCVCCMPMLVPLILVSGAMHACSCRGLGETAVPRLSMPKDGPQHHNHDPWQAVSPFKSALSPLLFARRACVVQTLLRASGSAPCSPRVLQVWAPLLSQVPGRALVGWLPPSLSPLPVPALCSCCATRAGFRTVLSVCACEDLHLLFRQLFGSVCIGGLSASTLPVSAGLSSP